MFRSRLEELVGGEGWELGFEVELGGVHERALRPADSKEDRSCGVYLRRTWVHKVRCSLYM